jgi:hypothetical protein
MRIHCSAERAGPDEVDLKRITGIAVTGGLEPIAPLPRAGDPLGRPLETRSTQTHSAPAG